jgi:hypothetical protein
MEGSPVSVEQRESEAAAPQAVSVAAPPTATRAAALAPSARASPLAAAAQQLQVLSRAQAAASQLLPRVQYQVTRLGPAGQAGLAAIIAALVFAATTLLPARHALDALRAGIVTAQHPSAAQNSDQAAPRLVESLPTRNQIPALIGLMYTQAKASNVSLDVGHYAFSQAKSGTLARYEMEFPVRASYPDIRSFINKTLTAVPAATLAKLHVERKTVGDPTVNANIAFVVFVRSE